jgi:manganese/zinc/iron transport system substrate-binding protein
MKSSSYLFLILSIALSFLSCQERKAESDSSKLKVVCTTGMIGDATRNIGDTLLQVETLMGAGVDPHLYKATQGDLKRLSSADLILYNGLHLEGKMGEVFEKLSRQKRVVAVAESLDTSLLINSSGYAGAHDPHVWFDLSLWSQVCEHIASILAESDPGNAKAYEANAARYISRIKSLHDEVREQLKQIPQERRVLITAHDAFEYFGKAYAVEVRGLQGISTTSEYGIFDIRNLAEFIAERKINAVFVESSVSPKALEAVVAGCKEKGHDVRIGGTLFSDALGAEGSPEGTYLGMVRSNLNTIVSALK